MSGHTMHARWASAPKTMCGEQCEAVRIRRPEDWARVTCPGCHYAAGREDE